MLCKKKKKQKLKDQQFWSTFAYFSKPQLPDGIPTHLDRVNFRIWDNAGDNKIELMVTYVQSINMLDLDETEITNYSIKLLTQLSFIKELRLKGYNGIDDHAIAHINNIKGLELLHIDGTSISLQGVMQLAAHHPFQTILIGVDKPEQHIDELTILTNRFPACKLIVNHKDFSVKKPDEWS